MADKYRFLFYVSNVTGPLTASVLDDNEQELVSQPTYTIVAIPDASDWYRYKTDVMPSNLWGTVKIYDAINPEAIICGNIETLNTNVVDKTGFILAPSGLDFITNVLNSFPTNWREWQIWESLRLRNASKDKSTGIISVLGTDGTTPISTQATTDNASEDTIESPGAP